jgi:uncharacterized protein YdhG (YjbR/CyaY superfamily)
MKAKNPHPARTDFPPGIGNPARSALEHAGYTKLKQLTRVSEAELGQLHGMGPKALGLLREALKAKGWSFRQGKPGEKLRKKGSPVSRTDMVEEFLQELSHPLKAEVEAVRSIIKGVNNDISEEIKWKAPSFNYKGEYLVTFNLWETKRIHLVFHNPTISKVKSSLLEGNYEHRRMMYLENMKEIKAKRAELERIVKQLVELND